MNKDSARKVVNQLKSNLKKMVRGRDKIIDLALTALFSNGNVLVDDYRGSGLPLLSKTLGGSLNDDIDEKKDHGHRVDIQCFARVNCTRALKFQDIIGTSSCEGTSNIYNYILFAENFDRANPTFQTNLTQAMEDRMVYGSSPCKLGDVFTVIASLNLSDSGVASLSFSVADHFQIRYQMGWLNAAEQRKILEAEDEPNEETIAISEVIAARDYILKEITIDDEIKCGLTLLAQYLGESEKTLVNGGPSIKCLKDFINSLKAWLFINGQDEASCEDVWKAVGELGKYGIAHHMRKKPNLIETPSTIFKESYRALSKKKDKSKKTFKEMLEIEGKSSLKKEEGAEDKEEIDLDGCWEVYKKLQMRLESQVYGRSDDLEEGKDKEKYGVSTIELILTALFSGGHILFEDFPGSGKSYMTQILGRSIEDDVMEDVIDIENYRRIQCTPDLLPSDITGYMALRGNEMVFQRGPIFAYVVLIDEINRTTPKVQSAVLEAMGEKQVTVEDKTYDLGQLFFVMATQNPLDRVGTFELPAAQLDRFLFKRRLKYIKKEYEGLVIAMGDDKLEKEWKKSKYWKEGINGEEEGPAEKESMITVKVSDIIRASEHIIKNVEVHPDVLPCLLDIADHFQDLCEKKEGKEATLEMGSRPSPRTLQKLLKALKVRAFIHKHSNAKPELEKLEVQPWMIPQLACDVFRHRIIPKNPMDDSAIDDLIRSVVEEEYRKYNKHGGM